MFIKTNSKTLFDSSPPKKRKKILQTNQKSLFFYFSATWFFFSQRHRSIFRFTKGALTVSRDHKRVFIPPYLFPSNFSQTFGGFSFSVLCFPTYHPEPCVSLPSFIRWRPWTPKLRRLRLPTRTRSRISFRFNNFFQLTTTRARPQQSFANSSFRLGSKVPW